MYLTSSLLLPKDQVLQRTFTRNTTMYLMVAGALECRLAPCATELLSRDFHRVCRKAPRHL